MDKGLGEYIKRIRKNKGITQETLAVRIGVTRSYISLIESGRKIPAIATLYKLSNILGVDFFNFFSDKDGDIPAAVYKNINQKNLLNYNTKGYEYKVIFQDKKNKIMDIFIIKVSPGKKSSEFIHEGEEFMLILSGKLKVIHGSIEYILKKNDSIYIDSSIKHQFEAIGDEEVYFLSVNTNKFKK